MTIKAEDISEELLDAAYLHVLSEGDGEMRAEIASILNAAIEAGVVSPPCCCGRIQPVFGLATGPVMKLDDGNPILWAKGSKPINVVLEHWKGQTE